MKKGFTLVEILVYIGIFFLVVTIIISFVFWLVRSNAKLKVMRETLDNANRAMDIIIYETKMAKSIYTPTTSSDQLSLETTSYLPEEEETTYIDFYLCDSALCFKKESQDPVALTSDSVEITNLVFTRIVSGEADCIQIDLSVNYKNPGNRPEYRALVDLTSTVSLRIY